MSDFQTDQNRSELLQSQNFDHNITNQHPISKNENENDLNYNDTFSTYDSSNDKILSNNTNRNGSKDNYAPQQFILSDNNFTLTERADKNATGTNEQVEIETETEEEEEEEETHTVRINVSILGAFPMEKDDKEPTINESVNKPRATEGPKPINFYKFEYQLTPDDPDTCYAADLVTYKSAVKVYVGERGETKVIKAWEQDNKIWVTWNHSHEIKFTKDRLLKFFDHEIVFKIWDSKDYCFTRTKFEKPKPFKFSKTGEHSDENVRASIIDQCDKYLKQIPPELHDKLEKKLPNQKRPESPSSLQEASMRASNYLIAYRTRSNLTPTIGNKLNELASDTDFNRNVKSKNNESQFRNASKMSKVSSSERSGVKTPKAGRIKEKSKREIAQELEFIRKNGATRIKIQPKVLFSGSKFIMKRLEENIPTVDDCFISFSLENNLMSEQQLFDLNPLTIKIEKATNLPNKPISFTKLREMCNRTYCSYNFFKQDIYKTSAIAQDKDLFFNDTNVYLTGLLNRDELHEYLHQSPFEIEVHDRDRKPLKAEPLKPCLFGHDPIDDHISSVNSVASKHTLHDPFNTKDKRWDPYGVAKLNLYELVLGKKLLEFFVPVLPCVAPDVLGRNAHKNSSNTKVLENEDTPLSAGEYLDSNTHLNVKVTIAKPLFHNKISKSQKAIVNNNEKSCVFGRIVLKINSSSYNLIRTILQLVRDVNAKSLQFSDHPVEVQEAALSTYKLNDEEQFSKTLDILTGFHLIDDRCHIFVLEGLKDSAIKLIYEKIPSNGSECEVLYNSSMNFSKRLYGALDVDLIKIKLFEPLEEIVKKPILYIRDMTPKISFDALIKLHQLLSEYKLRNVMRCELLPTSQMILSMSKEFGIPLTESELKQFRLNEFNENKENIDSTANQNTVIEDDFGYTNPANIPHTSRIWTPIDNYNDDFLAQKKKKKLNRKITFRKIFKLFVEQANITKLIDLLNNI